MKTLKFNMSLTLRFKSRWSRKSAQYQTVFKPRNKLGKSIIVNIIVKSNNIIVNRGVNCGLHVYILHYCNMNQYFNKIA